MPVSENIFLSGFMGSGKTTLGKKLAQLLRINFVDLDKYIEQKCNKSISQLFIQEGEEAFRIIEQQCLIEVLNNHQRSVISLGGGTVCFFDNLDKVKQSGLLIYLQLPAKVLAERIKKSKTIRPLLQNLKADELITTIDTKLKNRQSFYEQAHIITNGLNLTAQLLQHNIIEYKKKNNF